MRVADPWPVALALVESEGPDGRGACVRDLTGCGEDMSEIEQDLRLLAQKIGQRGECSRGASQGHCLSLAAAVGKDPGQ